MIYAEVQIASKADNIPDQEQFQTWLETALAEFERDFEVVIRVVDSPESGQLNQQFRHLTGATNVLSFPVEMPDNISLDLIGDLVICAPVVTEEAKNQNKQEHDHWAHMVIHGVLHLLGYDHIEEQQAQKMESKEIAILKQLKINNPYNEAVVP